MMSNINNKDIEQRYKRMTEMLRLTNTDEEVANYLRWIITSDMAKEHWKDKFKENQDKEISSVDIFTWLKEQNYQTEREETGEYSMYFDVDMPKIINDALKEFK